MNFSTGIIVLICVCCWVVVVIARSGGLGGKRGARDSRGVRVLRGALERRDVPDVRSVQSVRDVEQMRSVRGLRGLRGKRRKKGEGRRDRYAMTGAVINASSVQFGYKSRQPGDTVAVQRSLGILVQVFDAVAPVRGWEGVPRGACEDALQMNEFAVENVMVHCWRSP